MEELALELLEKMGHICAAYYYSRKSDAITEGEKLAQNIREFTISLLEGISMQEQTEENMLLQQYILEVLNDYTEAVSQKDEVLMIDTLDFGLRELLDIFAAEETEGAGE